MKTTSTLQSTLSRYQSSRSWRYRGLNGSLARGTSGLSPATSRRFPLIVGDIAGATYARISSLDAVRTATVALTMRRSWRTSVLGVSPEPGLRVWVCSTDHCWKHRYTTDILYPICAAIRIYVYPACTGLQCELVKMVEVVQQEYVFLDGELSYPRVNIAKTVHIWKHRSYCLHSQNRGRKDRHLKSHLTTNDHYKWITNTTTLSMNILYFVPWCQYTVLEGVA